MTYKYGFMDFPGMTTPRDGFAARSVTSLFIALLGALCLSGCITTGPPGENEPMFTMEEKVRGERIAARNAWAAGKRAAEAGIAEERKLVDKRIEEAVERGRKEGDAIAVERIAAEQAAAEKAAAEKAAAKVAAVKELFARTPLFGERKLRSDKGRALAANQLVEMLYAQLRSLDCTLVISVPHKANKAVRAYDQQKILLLMSSEFNEAFVERIQKMSIMDGLNLLNKLYGFSAWFAHDGKTVWLGFPATPPTPRDNTKVDLYFSEKEFMQRVN